MSSSETTSEFQEAEDRITKLRRLGRPDEAIVRHLKDQGIKVPPKSDAFHQNVVSRLSDSEFETLLKELKYAGRQTVNYFVIKGISDYDIDKIESSVKNRLPSPGKVTDVEGEPFIAGADQYFSRLYLAIGYNTNAGSEDPITGRKGELLATKRTVVVIHEDRDLVEIRGSDRRMVERVRDEVCKSIGKYRESMKGRPKMGAEFQEEFSDLVQRYLNMKVKIDDKSDDTLSTIAFTSDEDDSGDRYDTRESERVNDELSRSGSEITMGYVVLEEGLRFQMNREQSKLSFRKAESEQNLIAVADIIHDVLREAGEYSQEQITGTSDVPK